ncbi:MAG: transglycosylase SLT domain-containing protein [Thiohalocapsa sp.]|nr:transglycosylase SLT domain-containing protein [Thiohalocapsa sp.]MCF7989002.1 transglycosylase SLT domain-containing protein [Thiohalocapsa sp.]
MTAAAVCPGWRTLARAAFPKHAEDASTKTGADRPQAVRRAGGLLLLAGLGVALLAGPGAARADVYKYVDDKGNIYFSDEPLRGETLRLEWKRTAKRLAAENKEQSDALRNQQATQARLQAGLKSSNNLYSVRPAAPVSGSMSVRRARYQHLIEAEARRNGLTPDLLHAVIRTESAYKSNALSHAGACGLMQLMPGTAERFRVRDIWDPAENIRGGATYLRFLLDLFQNDLQLALAGYNAGENAVKRHGYQIPPYRETQDYVRKVLRHLSAERSASNS